jgi:hypothetical protein
MVTTNENLPDKLKRGIVSKTLRMQVHNRNALIDILEMAVLYNSIFKNEA